MRKGGTVTRLEELKEQAIQDYFKYSVMCSDVSLPMNDRKDHYKRAYMSYGRAKALEEALNIIRNSWKNWKK